MNIKFLFFIVGVILIVLKWKKLIVLNNWWIALCFVAWFFLFFLKIHNKNKDRNTPRPVYLAN